jgi:hypothetical protein
MTFFFLSEEIFTLLSINFLYLNMKANCWIVKDPGLKAEQRPAGCPSIEGRAIGNHLGGRVSLRQPK